MSLDIRIKTISHSEQRYETCGDWQTPEEGFKETAIIVSELGDRRMEFCVAVHELIEMFLAQERGISAKAVTEFDEKFEAKREEDDDSEPGDDPSCPVYREHGFATSVEFLLVHELGVDRKEYEERINNLGNERDH